MKKPLHTLVVCLLVAGLVTMFVVTIMERMQTPLVKQAQVPQQQMAMPSADPLGQLMNALSEDPENVELLLALGRELIARQKFDSAKQFLEKAQLLDVNNPEPVYQLGYIAFQKQNYPEAVTFMEQSLRLKDQALVRLSLGVLYTYHLKDTAKGKEHWQKALQCPDITSEQKELIQSELNKLTS